MKYKILAIVLVLLASAMTGCVDDDSSKLEDAIDSRAIDNEHIANQLKLAYDREVWRNDTVTLYNNGERIYKLKMLNEPEFIEINDERYIHDIEHYYDADAPDEFHTIVIIPNMYEQRISHKPNHTFNILDFKYGPSVMTVKRGIIFVNFDTWKMLHTDYYRFYEGYIHEEEHDYYNENFDKTQKLNEMELR